MTLTLGVGGTWRRLICRSIGGVVHKCSIRLLSGEHVAISVRWRLQGSSVSVLLCVAVHYHVGKRFHEAVAEWHHKRSSVSSR